MDNHESNLEIINQTRKRWASEVEKNENGEHPLAKEESSGTYEGFLIDLGATVAAIQEESLPAILNAIEQTMRPEMQNLSLQVERLRKVLQEQPWRSEAK